MAQYLRPNGEPVQVWTPSTGSTCWQCIDEEIASDTDYMYGKDTEQPINLSAGRDPGVNTDFKIYARVKTSGVATMTVYLYQNTTLITTIPSIPLTKSYVQKTWTIPEEDAANITDFSKLILSFKGDIMFSNVYVSHAYMKIPDAPIKNGLEMGCSF